MDDKQILAHLRLHLAAQMTDVEQCWQEGYDSCGQNLDATDNPYEQSSKEYHYWNEGWWCSYYNEDPVFNERMATDFNLVTEHVVDIHPHVAKTKTSPIIDFIKIAGLRLLEFSTALMITVAGYQLVDLAFI